MSYRVIGASAGTGKTYRLTTCVVDAFMAGLAPEGLCGVTFTKKAAGELGERLRTRLFAEQRPELAQRLGMAYVGTVNSVGLRLIAEYAVEAGLSPEVGVLPEDGGRFLHALLERVLSEPEQRSLDALAWRLRIRYDAQRGVVDWHSDVFAIVDFARMNRIGPEALPAMAERAWQSYAALFDPPGDAETLDANLREALDEAAERYDRSDKTKTLQMFLGTVGARRQELASDIWDAWGALAKAELGKPNYGRRDALRAAAATVLSHPRLHADVAAYLRQSYAAAAAMLATFAEWKKAARVVDHTDQLDLAWRVLGQPEVAADLAATLGLVVVDELQDSNPLQMALYTRLHPLAGRSVWVGDPKQCIFEWNGADPALVDVVLAAMKADGGDIERLAVNRRSRPELVGFISELFASAFADHGMAPEDVRVSAFRQDPPGLADLPPLGLAFYDPRAESLPGAAAARVAALLSDPGATPVVDRLTGVVRPLVAGDIAVLLPSNKACRALAGALGAYGIRAATAQSGLLQTAEGWLVRAALALVVAPDDPIAEAELEALIGRDGDLDAVLTQREAWLAQRLSALANPAERGPGRWSALLDGVRRELPALSPSGVLERIYATLDVPRRVLAWPDGAARCANLDAIRRLVAGYESLETARTRPLTVSGLLRAFAAVVQEDADMPLIDEQHVTGGPDAVQVMTYHKAKGLEWPVVVLGGLDKSERRTAFEVACESDAAEFSLADPLASRWIRYWPWPFTPARKGELFNRVAQSDFGAAVTLRERRERVRLLYVGFTRARDHLVLLVSDKDGDRATQWLDELAREGQVAWRFTADPAHGLEVTGPDGAVMAVRTRTMGAPLDVSQAAPTSAHAPATVLSRPAAVPAKPRRDVSPSRTTDEDLARLGVRAWAPRGPTVTLGEPLAVATPSGFTDWDRLGTAIHGFFAGDVDGAADRWTRAQAWSGAHGTVAKLAPATLIEAADRFEAWVAQRWPGATIVREIPIAADIVDGGNLRRISGVIDALIETPSGWVVVDHKSFPAAGGARKKAAELAPQLALYTHALGCQAAARPVVGICLHFPIAGTIVELA